MSKRGSNHKNLIMTLLISLATALILAVAFGVMYVNGLFLPKWINWENQSFAIDDGNLNVIIDDRRIVVTENNLAQDITDHDAAIGEADQSEVIWTLKSSCKVQSALAADIDNDKRDELLVLCWRIGRYGHRRPFWVKHDELSWSQHIYIYDIEGSSIRPKWMASDIGIEVKNWEVSDNLFITTHSTTGNTDTWAWISWGLERIPQEYLDNTLNGRYLRKLAENNPSDEEQVENSARIVMVGDVLLHTGVAKACQSEQGEYDFHPVFENTKDVIESADLAIVNQEVIIGGEELGVTGYPSFNAPYELADALVDTGFDVICHATNHALDKGKKGLMNCISNWEERYPQIDVVGIYKSEEDRDDICITEVNGIKLAILNYTYGTNGIPLPKDMPFAVSLLSDRELIRQQLEYAEANADFTIVCPHWGTEYRLDYNAEQESMAKFLVENGADLIIGTHPHVIEPVEWVESDNGNRGLCYYSLGNFINWTSGRGGHVADRMLGGIADVTIGCDEDGAVDITSYAAVPIVSHVENVRGRVSTYLLEEYTEDMADSNAIRSQDSGFSPDYCYRLCNEVWGCNY